MAGSKVSSGAMNDGGEEGEGSGGQREGWGLDGTLPSGSSSGFPADQRA